MMYSPYLFDFYGKLVGKYTSPMDPVGNGLWTGRFLGGSILKFAGFASNLDKVSVLLLMVLKSGEPLEVGSWNPIIFQGFVHPRWLFGISEPSTVGH